MVLKILLLLSILASVNLAAAAAPGQGKATEAPEPPYDVPPKYLKRVDPVYPYNQERAGVDGAVTVLLEITTEGQVRNVYVVKSNNPAFERPAIDAVREWKFSPGLKDGRPVNVRAQQEIVFSMSGSERAGGFWRIAKGKNHSSLPPKLRWDEPPRPARTAFPVYPWAALEEKVDGKTLINFVVGPTGRVVEAKVIQATTPEMGLAALAMIDAWYFTPPKKKDGTPVFAALSLEHEFKVSGEGDVPVTFSARDILVMLKKHPEKIIAATQLDQPLKPISQRPPIYPLALSNAGPRGSAVIEFFIDSEGDAQLPRIVSSSAPEFGYAAAQAVAAWRFEPPKKKGKPVATQARVPIEFKFEPASATVEAQP